MTRRILVTGSTGYIGKYLTAQLLKQEENELYGFNRTYDARLEASNSLEGSIMEADLSAWFERVRPDVVFHCIGTSTQSPFANQLLVNAEGTRRLLQALVDNGLRPKVIVVGSAAEYGLRDEAVDENAICVPEGEYGIAKLAQTQIAQSFARRYDIPVLIGRVFNVYGHTGRHLALASMASQIAQAEALYPIPSEVHVYNLRSWRDFIYVDDMVDALLALAEKTTQLEATGQVYNIASGHSTAMSTILDMLLENSRLGKEELKKVALRLHGHQKEDISWANIEKIREHTGWEPKVSLADGVLRELNYWRANIGDTVPVAGSRP